jgi:hypothetical protein
MLRSMLLLRAINVSDVMGSAHHGVAFTWLTSRPSAMDSCNML